MQLYIYIYHPSVLDLPEWTMADARGVTPKPSQGGSLSTDLHSQQHQTLPVFKWNLPLRWDRDRKIGNVRSRSNSDLTPMNSCFYNVITGR